MSSRVAAHIRGNVVGYVAIFLFAIGGTASAIDGPLADQNQVGSEDIINEEVKREDLGSNAVRTGKVLDETLLAEDIAAGAVASPEVLTNSLTTVDLGTDSVGHSELRSDAFNSEIADTGTNFGIAGNAIQGEEVSANSLSGFDIYEASLAPSIHAVAAAGSDTSFGSTISSRDLDNPTNVLTDEIGAGTWIVFAEIGIFNSADDATSVDCGIWTDSTRREFANEGVESINDDSGDLVNLPLTATFTISSAATLRLACINSSSFSGVLKPITADLVAIPVNSLG